jgi:hypothetical protein
MRGLRKIKRIRRGVAETELNSVNLFAALRGSD